MPKLIARFIVLAVTEVGVTPAKYSDNYFEFGLQGRGLPIFETAELATAEIPKIAERYYERSNVPVLIVAPCFVPVEG